MFDFEKLIVYQKAKTFNRKIRHEVVKSSSLDISTRSQLSRSSMSVILNIAEGAARYTKPDKKHFYIMARGSLFESIAICNFLHDEKIIERDLYFEIYDRGEEISKILFSLINQLRKS